jgi:folate-binding protein YgfZ
MAHHRPHRSVLAVTGADAQGFLERLITQHVPPPITQGGEPGLAYGGLLTPQGKVIVDLFLWTTPEGYGLEVDADLAPSLAIALTRYRLRAKVEIAPRTDLAVAVSSEPLPQFGGLADPRAPGLGFRAVGPAAELSALPSGEAADSVRRLLALAPEAGRDYAPETAFAADVNLDLLAGVDFRKGCFVGQEVASRMHRKGGVRKRTVRLEADAPLAPHTPVLAGDFEVGETLATAGPLAGGGHGILALVRLDRVAEAQAEGTPLTVGGVVLRAVVGPGDPATDA